MRFSWQQILRTYFTDLQKRVVLYSAAGLFGGAWIMDSMKWKSNLSDWLIILPIMLLGPLILNFFIAIYRFILKPLFHKPSKRFIISR